MKLSKKGQIFSQLSALGVGIAALSITLVVTFLILSQAKTQIGGIEGGTMGDNNGSLAWNATVQMTEATATIPGWVPLIVIASIGAILLSLVAVFRR